MYNRSFGDTVFVSRRVWSDLLERIAGKLWNENYNHARYFKHLEDIELREKIVFSVKLSIMT